MRLHRRLILPIALLALVATGRAESSAWSNRAGKTIQAELTAYDPVSGKVTLKLANGTTAVVAATTLSDADQAFLTEPQRKLDERLAELKTNSGKVVACQSDGPEQVTYHVYYPTTFDPAKPPAMIILFSPGGSGTGILNPVKDACEKLGWVGVGCDAFRNNTDESALDKKWSEVLPHIEKTVLHNPDLLYLGGMSGGALRAYDYSESTARPWKGVLAFGGWLGGKESLHCAPKMAVAVVNGSDDKSANSNAPRDEKVLKDARCVVRTFSFPGGHQIAPPAVVLQAMQWLQETTTPGNRMSKGKRSRTPLDPDLDKVR